MSPQLIAFIVLVVVNFMLIVGMVFLERKDPKSCIAWALSFLVLPFVSWFIYIMVGKGPKFSKRRWSKRKQLADKKLEQRLKNGDFNFYEGSNNENSQIVKLNYYYGGSPCQSNNEVEFFIDAHEMYDRQLEDIKNATESINVMYYLFKSDAAGKTLRDALIEKAKQGVKVNVVYDSSGNLKTNLYFFRDLIKAGGKVHPFFPSIFKLINSNFCYRNHRKIVVIDGKIGYIGGMNIGVDYLSQDKRIKPWFVCYKLDLLKISHVHQKERLSMMISPLSLIQISIFQIQLKLVFHLFKLYLVVRIQQNKRLNIVTKK